MSTTHLTLLHKHEHSNKFSDIKIPYFYIYNTITTNMKKFKI